MPEILKNFFFQLLFTAGVVIFFGILLRLIGKAFYKIAGKRGRPVELITGIIGTPIHELSHAAMCLLFGHKIVDIKLYTPNAKDGTLGYVSHTYNKKNPYKQIGNFFIGTAPVVLGSLVILLVMLIFVPSVFKNLREIVGSMSLSDMSVFRLDTYTDIAKLMWSGVGVVFGFSNLANFFWWVFLLVSLSIAIHMRISPEDIRSSVKGIIFIIILFLIVDSILYFINIEYMYKLTEICLFAGSFVANFMVVAVLLLLALLLFALIIKGIAELIKLIAKRNSAA